MWRPTVASLLAAGIALVVLRVWFVVVRAWLPALPGRALQLAVDGVVYGMPYLTCWLALPRGRVEAREVLSHRRALAPS